jgi:phage/plasmid-associated DNA primase
MKFLTGNDPINARNLYKSKMETYQPQFKLALLCNDIPEMDSNDDAVWARCRCVEFPITFVDNPKTENQ